jgi:hypothetical protein
MCDTCGSLDEAKNVSGPFDTPMHMDLHKSSLINGTNVPDLSLELTGLGQQSVSLTNPTESQTRPDESERTVVRPSDSALCDYEVSKDSGKERALPAEEEFVEAEGSTTGEQATHARTWKLSSLKRNNLKKSIAKVSGTLPSARAKAAEDRSAVILAFATEWVQTTEEELAGQISAKHAHAIREAWQKRVYTLSQFQRKRVYLKVDKLYGEWLLDPHLQKRLDQPWLDAVANSQYVRLHNYYFAQTRIASVCLVRLLSIAHAANDTGCRDFKFTMKTCSLLLDAWAAQHVRVDFHRAILHEVQVSGDRIIALNDC